MMDETEAGKKGNCGEPVLECCENRQQKCLISVTSDHGNQGKLQHIATELQLQAERAPRRASIYKRHKQAKLFYTMQQWCFPCQLWLQNQLSRREKGNYIKLQVNSLAPETFLLAALFTGVEGKEP